MDEPSAFGYQPSVKPVRGFVWAFVLTFALVFLFASSTFASDNCGHKVWNWKVDKSGALEVQKSVNEGHEPWRMDDTATVAGQAIDERKKEWADYNTVVGAPKPISETKDTALMVATSEEGRVRYEVTLRKYSWLLRSAKKWQWIIWLPVRVERIECPTTPH
ncbi:MAG: hypothetical protein WCC92_19935 [Candidatus Korobacteraceae bacterium]